VTQRVASATKSQRMVIEVMYQAGIPDKNHSTRSWRSCITEAGLLHKTRLVLGGHVSAGLRHNTTSKVMYQAGLRDRTTSIGPWRSCISRPPPQHHIEGHVSGRPSRKNYVDWSLEVMYQGLWASERVFSRYHFFRRGRPPHAAVTVGGH
jgi:hypothetical protein